MTNFPWPMDKPVEEFRSIEWYKTLNDFNHDAIEYFLTRLKIAERERDELRRAQWENLLPYEYLKEHHFDD